MDDRSDQPGAPGHRVEAAESEAEDVLNGDQQADREVAPHSTPAPRIEDDQQIDNEVGREECSEWLPRWGLAYGLRALLDRAAQGESAIPDLASGLRAMLFRADLPSRVATAGAASPGKAANDPDCGVPPGSGPQAVEEGSSDKPGTANVIKVPALPGDPARSTVNSHESIAQGAIPAMDDAPSGKVDLPPYWDDPTPLHYFDRWPLEGLGSASRSQIKASLRKVHADFLEDKAGELPEVYCWRRAYDVFAIQFEEANLLTEDIIRKTIPAMVADAGASGRWAFGRCSSITPSGDCAQRLGQEYYHPDHIRLFFKFIEGRIVEWSGKLDLQHSNEDGGAQQRPDPDRLAAYPLQGIAEGCQISKPETSTAIEGAKTRIEQTTAPAPFQHTAPLSEELRTAVCEYAYPRSPAEQLFPPSPEGANTNETEHPGGFEIQSVANSAVRIMQAAMDRLGLNAPRIAKLIRAQLKPVPGLKLKVDRTTVYRILHGQTKNPDPAIRKALIEVLKLTNEEQQVVVRALSRPMERVPGKKSQKS
ncbi:MAG: hypothetical protein ABSC05_34615 [Candidatus Solibacter sp.]